MILGIIIVAVLLVFLIIFSFYLSDEGKGNFDLGIAMGMFIVMLSIAEMLMICNISEEPKPKAIDVYRNKTKLEITSVNGVPRDTVVVWKNN